MYIVYKITNKINGMSYVGRTIRSIEERFSEHARADSHIGKAIRKYGRENFRCEILEHCRTLEQLNEREIYWIATCDCKEPRGYNQTDGGDGCLNPSPTLTEKKRAAMMGHEVDDDTRRKISKAKMGHTVDVETREKISLALKGRKLSAEVRANMSAERKKRIITPETRAKLSAAGKKGGRRKGSVVTPETRAKLSAANKGKTLSPEHRAKIAESNRGKKHRKRQ